MTINKSKTVKVFAVVAGTVAALSMASSAFAAGLTSSQVDSIVSLLSSFGADSATINNVRVALTGTGTTVPTPGTCTTYTFSKNLKLGSTGVDVKALQVLLNKDGVTQVAATGVGSAGNETTYFGAMTKAAVIKFQNKYAAEVLAPIGLTKGTGIVGSMSLAKLNVLSICTTTTPTGPVVTGPVTVSLSETSPVGAALVNSQAGAKLADFKLSGNGTVTSITLKRSGFSTQDALTNVYLYDGATRLTDGYTFNANGDLVINGLSIAVSGSKVISVKADVAIAAATGNSTIVVSLVGYTADGTVSTASVNGNLVQFVSGTLAGVTLVGPNTVASAPTINAGTMNYTVWGNSLSVATRSVKLGGAIFKVIGSAPSASLVNARLFVDGVQAGSAVSVNSLGNIAFDFSAAPVTLTTGSHSVEVRADVVGGSSRNFYISLASAGDLVLTDTQYAGVNVAITSDSFSPANANSTVISIGFGTIALTKDTTFDTSVNVTSGASNIAIAKYKIKAYGEDMKVKQILASVVETPTSGLKNVAIFVNGGQVGSSQNLASTSPASVLAAFNLGSSLIIPAGTEVSVEVRADLFDAANAAFIGTIATEISVPTSQAQGMSSQSLTQAVTPGTTSVTSGPATAVVAKSLATTDKKVSANSSNNLIGSFVIKAGTTEGLRVTNLAVGITTDTPSVAATGNIEITDLANLTISVDGGAKLTPVNPSTINNFSVDFTVDKGLTKIVNVYADVTGATNDETINTTLLATLRGASSNTVITGSGADGISAGRAGQTMTIGSGTLNGLVVITSADTAAQYVISGKTAQKIAYYGVTSTNGESTIQEMTFDMGTTTLGAITSISVVGDQGGSCSAPVIGSIITLTGCNIKVPSGYAGAALVATANLGTVGEGGVISGASAQLKLKTVKYSNGVSSATINLDGTTAPDLAVVATSSTMRLVGSVPSFALSSVSSVLQNGEVRLGSVKITANAAGAINLNKLPIRVVVSGTTVTFAASTTEDRLVLKEGNTTATTTDNVGGDNVQTKDVVVTLNTDFIVGAGQSRTLDIYGYFANIASTDNSVQISLAPASSLDWDDINGAGASLTGTLIADFPTNAVVVND